MDMMRFYYVYIVYAMFIKQSPTRFTIVAKKDTETGHTFLIYICGHRIQICIIHNNIAVIIIIIKL